LIRVRTAARELPRPGAAGVAVLIIGAPGAGKSTVLEAVSGVLSERGVAHACFEREQLEWGEPWLAPEAALPVLATFCRALREAGRTTFVVTATKAELQATLGALGADRAAVVALEVPPDVAAARVAAREPDWWEGKAALVAHSRELAAAIPALPGVDFVMANAGRDARATAVAIVDELAARGLTK
jgi:energy-coupling factor transporter ATP-binding protein EcfA2